MALELTELQAVTENYVLKQSVDIYFDENVLLHLLMGKNKMYDQLVQPSEMAPGGKMIQVILEYASSHSGSYGKTTLIPQSKKETHNAAFFRWAGYMGANTIDLDDQVQCNGDMALVNLVYEKMQNIQKSIREAMGSAIYASAADTNSFLGLGDLFNTTTSTAYGNIAEADMAKWAAKRIDTETEISFAALQTIRRTAKVGQNKSKKPDVYVTTDTLKDAFENSLHSQTRYKDVNLVNAGFDNILFGQVPVVADDNQTTKYCDALNTNFLDIKTHPDYAFTKPKWEYSKEQPDTLTANVRWIGQLICRHRAAHCRHTNLIPPT